MPRKNQISLRIDKLTESLQDAQTGESLLTNFRRATVRDIAKAKVWLFDWRRELKISEVYSLFTKGASRDIQGLISIQDRGDHIWVNLAEAAPHNLGKTKRYKGEFAKIKMILAKKKKQNAKVTITDRDLRTAGLEHLIADSGNGNDYPKLQERLFNGQSVDDLYRAAKQHWQKRKRQK